MRAAAAPSPQPSPRGRGGRTAAPPRLAPCTEPAEFAIAVDCRNAVARSERGPDCRPALARWIAAFACVLFLPSTPCRGDEFRHLSGRHITLVTDLPSSAEIDALPAAFDAAVPQYCQYFGVPAEKAQQWRVEAYLVGQRDKFEGAGLMPSDGPRFLHGYAEGARLWVHDQTSDYYRRHLLLHEGTHAFMLSFLGGCGPPWLMEGLAELVGTHAVEGGHPRLNWFPASREQVPLLGRIKAIQDARSAGQSVPLSAVLDYRPGDYLQNPPYAWSWAAAALLENHPGYRAKFHELTRRIRGSQLETTLPEALGDEWPLLVEDWQMFVAGLEHGYDFPRTTIDYTPAAMNVVQPQEVTIAADRGWQNTGLRLEAGQRYELSASGRYQLAAEPVVWWSEPGGVSIRYYQGRPLGVLLAAVRPDAVATDSPSPLLTPIVVGLGTTWTPEKSGTLFFKINDSAGALSDNAGELKVNVRTQ